MTALRKFLQLDSREAIARIGTEAWITVYSHESQGVARRSHFCALVPNAKLKQALSHTSWDLSIGDGLPGHSQGGFGPSAKTTYHRFGDDSGIEPLVFSRHFHDIKPSYIELLEEFRHFHNLYHDRHNGRYIRVLDSGTEEIVAEVEPRSVRIKTRELRQFLAVKQMHLLVFFDFVVEENVNLQDVTAEQRAESHAEGLVHYAFNAADARALLTSSGLPFSRLVGKKAITPLPLEQCGVWPYEERKQEFAEFIIGLDEHSKPIHHTCDPEKLANYFGKNPDAPHFLTPVVFRREVLKKYYEQPEKYEVEDGYLRCGSLWGLRLDNDAEERVTVFLGDLGETLTYEEQLHWKSCNKLPEGRGDLSETNIRRSVLAEFTDAKAPEHVFKREFTEVQEAWEKQFGWSLIRPMQPADAHVIKQLHAPTTSSVAEFESQLLLLTKLVVDSINDSKLVEALGSSVPNEKGISKLERFLSAKAYPETKRDIDFLRLLQETRSSIAAHRKGESYTKIANKLKLDDRPTTEVFRELLQSAITMLRGLKGPGMGESIESRSIGDRQDRADMIYLRSGRRRLGSSEVAPAEGDHGRASASTVGWRRSGRTGLRRSGRSGACYRDGDQHS